MSLRLSVGIPCFNEAATIARVLDKVAAQAPLVSEIIVVDDGSTDRTWEELSRIKTEWTHPVKLDIARLPTNQGKGAATREAIRHAGEPYFLIQDADLELDPADYRALIAPIENQTADAVFGNRFARVPAMRVNILSGVANAIVTWITNVLYGLSVADQACGYKLLRLEQARALALESDGFEICSEIAAKLGRAKARVASVPVTYNPRTMREGKKIRWRDGFIAVWTLVRYRL